MHLWALISNKRGLKLHRSPSRSIILMTKAPIILMSKISCVVVLYLSTSCGKKEVWSAGQGINPEILTGEKVYDEVWNFVDIGPRVSGTAGAENAALYLADHLKQFGYTPDVDEFKKVVDGRQVIFRNVVATWKGRGKGLIVLVSHYDTKSGISDDFVGANDSGSSTGLLLELARLVSQNGWAGCDIMFAFLDGEECFTSYSDTDGLQGSRRLAGILKREGRVKSVKAVIVTDMIGDRDLFITLPRNCTPKMMGLVFDQAREAGVRSRFGLADGMILDDHVPFINEGMPAVALIDFEYGSVPGSNDYWHTTNDIMSNLSENSLEITGRMVIRMINKIGR